MNAELLSFTHIYIIRKQAVEIKELQCDIGVASSSIFFLNLKQSMSPRQQWFVNTNG